MKASPKILVLGKQIVSDLGMANSVDTLGRWMSHHLAERITAAEEEPDPKKRRRLQDECCQLIIDLWERRSSLPDRARPLANLEEIMNAIVDLRSNETPYWGAVLRTKKTFRNPWLEFAKEIEKETLAAVRLAIFHALAESALPTEAEKVEKFREFMSEKEVEIVEELQRLSHPDVLGYLTLQDGVTVDTDLKVREKKTLKALQAHLHRLAANLEKMDERLEGQDDEEPQE